MFTFKNVHFAVLTISLLTATEIPKGRFPVSNKIHHLPAETVFNSRPIDIDLFVDFPQKNIETVSIFFKTDRATHFTEYLLPNYRGRYRYRYNPMTNPAKEIAYYFVVMMKDQSVYAAPLNKRGYIAVVERPLVDPGAYFKKRLETHR